MVEIIRLSSADNGGAVLAECALTGDDIIVKDGKICKRRTYMLLPEQYSELEIHKGPVAADELPLLADADEKCRAVIAGRRMLGYASNSAKQLAVKLRRKGFSVASASFAAERLLSEGQIDECADALRQAERLVASGKGRKRIIMQLRAKSFGDAAMKEVSLYLDTVDFSGICRRVIEKKWGELPTDTDELRKCVAALMRLGFTMTDIKGSL